MLNTVDQPRSRNVYQRTRFNFTETRREESQDDGGLSLWTKKCILEITASMTGGGLVAVTHKERTRDHEPGCDIQVRVWSSETEFLFE